MRYSKDPQEIGAKLGPKLVHLISQTIVATKIKLLDTEHRARVHSMQEVIDRAGHEIADLYRPVLQEVIGDTELPPSVREMLEKAMSGHHQWQAISGLAFYGTGASSTLSQIISNFLAPGVRVAIGADPQLLPSNETLAAIGARGIRNMGDIYDYSSGQGYSSDLVDNLVEANKQYPDFSTALEMLRRGTIGQDAAELALTRQAVPFEYHNALLELKRVLLSPADLADMTVRGIKGRDEAAAIASLSGVDGADFDALVADTGEPLGLEQMLEAFRRGFIDQERLQHGIKQSRIRDEWIDVAEQLRYSPMSVADAVNAVVQNHLTMEQGNSIAEQNGLLPGSFQTLYDTAGEPLSRTELEQLYNRGLIDLATVEQGLRESRLKNKYVADATQLHVKIPPIFTVQRALTYGGIPHERAIELAVAEGYSHDDAEWLVTAGMAERLNTFKTKVIESVTTAYEDNLMSQDSVTSTITGLGFTPEQADFILRAAEVRRVARAVSSAVSAIKNKYLAHHITANQASGLIDAMGVPAPQRDFLLALWSAESVAYTRQLTEAQVVKAHKLKLIDDNDAIARLGSMGYNEVDADLLLKGA